MGDIEEQIKELRRKAAAYDQLIELLKLHGQSLLDFSAEIKPFIGIQTQKRSNGVEQEKLNDAYKKLLNGDKLSYTVDELANFMGLEKGNYSFNKLCEMEGIEKIKEGKRVKAIFHLKR